MDAKRCTALIVLVVMLGFVSGNENYIDYGEETAEKTAVENVRQLYRALLKDNLLNNPGFGGIPLEHLMIRKSQRSPSLRLRFGRSVKSQETTSRPVSTMRYEDNN